jgi:hypothetical protein
MIEEQEEFNLVEQIDEPLNTFKIVHIHNRSDKYHLTRQILLDAAITQNTYCYFYHILSIDIDEFNEQYASFSWLVMRDANEADLYLNVNKKAFAYIINYIQTDKLESENITSKTTMLNEVIDLAIMFGMPKLVTELRKEFPKEESEPYKFSSSHSAIKHIIDLHQGRTTGSQ